MAALFFVMSICVVLAPLLRPPLAIVNVGCCCQAASAMVTEARGKLKFSEQQEELKRSRLSLEVGDCSFVLLHVVWCSIWHGSAHGLISILEV